MRKAIAFIAAASAAVPYPAAAAHTEIRTSLIAQQTPVWCWAASASMALKLLGFPDIDPGKNYQCGVVVAAFPGCEDDCAACVTRLGPLSDLVGVLDRYKGLADKGHAQTDALFSPNYVAHPRLDRIKRSLDLSHPVLAGISPDGVPEFPGHAEHVVLITYEEDYRGSGEDWVTVRDPFPYRAGRNPYAGYRLQAATGRVQLPWRVLLTKLNLSSAVFLEERSS